MIILLNGASSAGKSSIAKELQGMFDDLFLNMGCDKFMSMIPSKYQGQEKNSLWKWIKSTHDHSECITLEMNQRGKEYILAMYQCIALMAEHGFNIIIDDVCLDPHLLKQISLKLSSYNVYFIGIYCQLSVLEEREQARGNRVRQSARGQYDTIHHFYEYDLLVDTTQTSAHDCALQIKTFVKQHSRPKAFKQMLI